MFQPLPIVFFRFFRSLPIISLTAKVMTGDREKAIKAGVSDYAIMPVDPETLLTVIHSRCPQRGTWAFGCSAGRSRGRE